MLWHTINLNKEMIRLETLSDKLNHTAECKESIREAVNQNLGEEGNYVRFKYKIRTYPF